MGSSEHYDLKVLAKFGQTLNSVWTDVNSGFYGLVSEESDGEDDITGMLACYRSGLRSRPSRKSMFSYLCGKLSLVSRLSS